MMAWSGLRRRLLQDHGNTLVLFPVAVLIVLGLGALALDSATIYLGQRRLTDLAAAAAHDAAGSLDLAAFYAADHELRLDRPMAVRRVDRHAQTVVGDRSLDKVTCEVGIDGMVATVECRAEVRPMLSAFWPGLPGTVEIRAVQTTRAAHASPDGSAS